MANLTRNFTSGRMNKVVDERLIPNGEYIDALNVRMGSTEKSEIGVIENAKGNTLLATLQFNGVPLSIQAKCIGAYEDSANENIYWFVHDPAFPSFAGNIMDMIVSYNVYNNILTYHVVSSINSTFSGSTLNFSFDYVITGINKIGDLLFFTDDLNPPRFIDVKKSYPLPTSGGNDQFFAEDILVIKQPPFYAPSVTTALSGGQENFLQNRFICFAYRYQYENNEYSAISQFSAPAFAPDPFDFSANSGLNEGMTNTDNTAYITYNAGGPLVKSIDLLFKEANGNTIKVIEKLNKATLGILDNVDYVYKFDNSKILTVLPEAELLRLYDNVPLTAKAQTIMGNRLMYGNYTEGYDLIDINGFQTQLDYRPSAISKIIGNTELVDTTQSGDYTFGGTYTIADAIVVVSILDDAGDPLPLNAGSLISIDITLNHDSFTGTVPPDGEETQDINLTFNFTLPNDYTSLYAMITSTEFISYVGTVLNIEPVQNSENGFTFTDTFNAMIPGTLNTYYKYESGITAAGQPVKIIDYGASATSFGLQFPAMRFVNDLTTPTLDFGEYYKVTFAQAFFQKIANPKSLHSNRNYEIGIVYMDEFNRSTTTLVNTNNTVFFPCSTSAYQNAIQVEIPVSQVAPSWAKKYKFVIKADRETYETIYCNLFFKDPLSNNVYFLLEGENAAKVEQGDRLVVKADTSGATQNCSFATVLEKEVKVAGFLEIKSVLDPTVNITVPGGVYMKINPTNFSAVKDESANVYPGTKTTDANYGGSFPVVYYPMNTYISSTGNFVDYTVPAGSRIKLSFKFQRLGFGSGTGNCEKRVYTLEREMISSANYDNMKDWWDGDNVAAILNSGTAIVGGSGNCPILNEYDSALAPIEVIVNPDLCINKYQFYRDSTTQMLVLMVSGTRVCDGASVRPGGKSSVTVSIEVFRATNLMVFETEASEALPNIFFENNLSLPIGPLGEHGGNVQDQNFSLNLPAIVDTEFFNCFAFGNGVESYRIRDSITGNWFGLGNRVTSISTEEYGKVDQFANITYSGIYNNESNVNKLNEFNIGLLNFKQLEQSFGPIYILDGRETDVLALQEDKISYVLAGKNLLSDSAAGGAITSVPEVLGTQIARTEKYGISFNPESYIQWGYDRYFTDVKRGVVIQLKGNAYSNEQLKVVSDSGMRTWFRDTFNTSFNTQKLGGYDPYLDEYVLVSNDVLLPQPEDCLSCGVAQTFMFTGSVGDLFGYCVAMGVLVGESTLTWNILSAEGNNIIIDGYCGSSTFSTGSTSVSGSLIINKNNNVDNITHLNIQTDGPMTIEITVGCPLPQPLTIVEIVLTNDNDAAKTTHIQYRYSYGTFLGPLQSIPVTFQSGTTNPLASRYNTITGPIGSGAIPINGSIMTISSNKIAPDNFNFNPALDKFKYLRSPTLYENNSYDLSVLLSLADSAVPILGIDPNYYAEFNVGSGSGYLYMIWDYRQSHSTTLCYSEVSIEDVCCNCAECASNCISYSLTNTGFSDVTISYKECVSGAIIEETVPAESSLLICSRNDVFPTIPPYSSVQIGVVQFCGCPS